MPNIFFTKQRGAAKPHMGVRGQRPRKVSVELRSTRDAGLAPQMPAGSAPLAECGGMPHICR